MDETRDYESSSDFTAWLPVVPVVAKLPSGKSSQDYKDSMTRKEMRVEGSKEAGEGSRERKKPNQHEL